MKKPDRQIFLAIAALLCIATSALWTVDALVIADDSIGTPVLADGVVEEPQNSADFFEPLKDDRLIEVQELYEDEITARSTAATATPDSNEAEQLQREIHDLKAEAEIAAMEVFLDIAMEQGDEEKVAQLEDFLDELYNPEEVQPFDDGVVHSVAEQAGNTALREKDPDEL